MYKHDKSLITKFNNLVLSYGFHFMKLSNILMLILILQASEMPSFAPN